MSFLAYKVTPTGFSGYIRLHASTFKDAVVECRILMRAKQWDKVGLFEGEPGHDDYIATVYPTGKTKKIR